jgi:hypothetical protein
MTALILPGGRACGPRASIWTRPVLRPEGGALELAVLVAAFAAGFAAAYRPLWVLAACLLAGLVALVWVRPATAAYLLLGVTPLVAGIDRGVVVPLFRPNEPLLLVLGATLAARWLFHLRSGQVRLMRPDAIDLAVLLLAVTSSITPLMAMAVRGRMVSTDDLLYSLVLWKLAGFYFIVRAAVRSERQVHTCLMVSVAAACLVAVIGILQGFDVLGLRSFLAEYYAPFGYSERIATLPRGGSTLSLPAATADLMIMNLAVVAVLWLRRPRRTPLTRAVHVAVTGLLITATLAAGEFSTAIGLVIAMGALALVADSLALFGRFSGLLVVGGVVVWPVIADRLEGFSTASGIPVSWLGRLHNLQSYFWPELSSPGNLLLGVRPSARVPVASQATGWVWIESGYIWLLWGGGVPLLASFLFFTYIVATRGSRLARTRRDAVGAASAAAFVGVVVIAALMVFDPHLTYRGSGDEAFALIALMASAAQRRPWTTGGGPADRHRGVVPTPMRRATRRRQFAGERGILAC